MHTTASVSVMLGFLVCTSIMPLSAADTPRGKARWPEYPHVKLSNDVVEAFVFLPDAEKGYYRGGRFDWAGIVAQVTFKGHTFFGEWKDSRNPAHHDDVIGPAEEFGMGIRKHIGPPVGFEEARPGEPFMKIGVGLLEKTEGTLYLFYTNYRIIEPGVWRVQSGKNWIEFAQELKLKSGYACSYVKRVELPVGKPEMVLSHRLKNTGIRPFVQTHYNHNFLMIDDRPIGPAYALRFPFDAKPKDALRGLAEARGRELVLLKDVDDKTLFTELEGAPASADANDVTVENQASGAAVRIRGDAAPVQFNLFFTPTVVCPEVYIELKLAPGEEKRWETRYEFTRVAGL